MLAPCNCGISFVFFLLFIVCIFFKDAEICPQVPIGFSTQGALVFGGFGANCFQAAVGQGWLHSRRGRGQVANRFFSAFLGILGSKESTKDILKTHIHIWQNAEGKSFSSQGDPWDPPPPRASSQWPLWLQPVEIPASDPPPPSPPKRYGPPFSGWAVMHLFVFADAKMGQNWAKWECTTFFLSSVF